MTRFLPLLLLLPTAGCAVNPVDSTPELMLMSEKEEVELGAEEDAQLVQELGVLTEGPLVAFVEELGGRLVKVSQRAKLKHTFRVLDDPTVNAFALPGGYVYVTRGLLAHMPSEACLAGVMGHEVGHVAARHGANRASNDAVIESVLSFGGLLPDAVTDVMLTIFDGASGLIRRSFSRDDERQSDELGVEYATKLGYDAKDTAKFFAMVAKLNENAGSVIPAWKSTHPAPEERVVTVRRLAKEAQAKAPNSTYERHTERYLRKLEGLAVGRDPRNGIVKQGDLIHPRLNLRLPLPAGWTPQHRGSWIGLIQGEASIVIQVVAEKVDAVTHAKSLLKLPRVSPIGGVTELTIDGRKAARVEGKVGTKKGDVGAMVTLIEDGDRLIAVRGLVPWSGWKNGRPNFVAVGESVAKLTKDDIEAARPAVITIVKAARAGTFEELAKPHPVPPRAKLTLREVAIMNGVLPHTRIPKGRFLKLVRLQTQND